MDLLLKLSSFSFCCDVFKHQLPNKKSEPRVMAPFNLGLSDSFVYLNSGLISPDLRLKDSSRLRI